MGCSPPHRHLIFTIENHQISVATSAKHLTLPSYDTVACSLMQNITLTSSWNSSNSLYLLVTNHWQSPTVTCITYTYLNKELAECTVYYSRYHVVFEFFNFADKYIRYSAAIKNKILDDRFLYNQF